jgi:tRNA threonylcarbamoyladenosine biosynthesis protein TsaE
VIALSGPLGSGKTVFTKGIAKSLGITEEITSPTYTIVSEYSGDLILYHMDLYRTETDFELEHLGINEFLFGQGVTVIEWSEKAAAFLPEETIFVTIKIQDNETRSIHISGISL